ncbi:MmgE/PrpD family protein [Aquabacterium sp. J223]|uniref:MmgE/PrpD family protein n=1 Tax=Aquabacterium sp. J223 TaxID=2898431 RepID=UPI0021AD7040|nr:MmgE/PrpD family protein [Aquabacterium sp. J223]UUX97370.1 MmgE/PrpD family protein [Aquabacterium sp. J223]
MQGSAVTFALAQHSAAWRFSDLTPARRAQLRQGLLAWMTVTLPGAQEPLVHLLAEDALEQGGHEQATVVGHGFATSTRQAALVNAAASQGGTGDDALPMGSAVLLAALLALAEARGDSGRAFMTAFAAGQDLLDRIGAGSPGAPALAAAVGGAHLLQLDAADTAVALAMAGATARSATDLCRPMQAGKAAADGLLAAHLAARGCSHGAETLTAPMRASLPRQDEPERMPQDLAAQQRHLEARFRDLTRPVLDEADARALLRMIDQLDELPDLSPLAGVLAARPVCRH